MDLAQAEYELECEEAALDQEIDETARFTNEAVVIRVEASKVLTEFADSERRNSLASEIASQSAKPEVKLPKLVLPKFSGDVLQWTSVWEQFNAAVHQSDLPDVNKFTYLKSLLEGEAKEAIEGLPLTGQNYEKARKLLSDSFGRKERIIFKHVQELLGMASLEKQSSLTGLQKLQDGLLSHVRSLETLGITRSQYGVLLRPIVLLFFFFLIFFFKSDFFDFLL